MINKKLSFIFSFFLMFFISLFFFSCDSGGGGGDTTTPIQKVELNLTKFSYKSDFTNSNQNLFKSSTPYFSNLNSSILSGGNILELTPKNANKELIDCYSGETNCNSETKVRTYKETDIVDFTKNSLVYGTLIDYARYISFEIYNSNRTELLYKTNGDIDIGESTEAFRTIMFNLHPTGNANLDGGKLSKQWQFNLPLSDTTNTVFIDSNPAKIEGTTICASPDNGGNYPATKFILTHDTSNKKLYSSWITADDLYVNSPCKLRVAAYDSSNEVIIDGQVQFEVDQEKTQEVDTIHFDTKGQAILSFMQPVDSSIIYFNIQYSALDSSIKAFLGRDPNLQYKLRLVAPGFVKILTLTPKDNILKGEVDDCPLNTNVAVTLQVYKDNVTSVWLQSSQVTKFQKGENTLPPFDITYKKTINAQKARTTGQVSISVQDDSGNAIPNAVVSFSTSNSNENIVETTDENGMVTRYGIGNSLVYGAYTVNISADNHYSKSIGFYLPENGMINKTVELIEQANFPSSKILTSRAQEQTLNNWYGNSNQTWSLCYRRSTNGASSSTFHSKCNNKGPTMTIIKLDNGKIIGGYASGSWVHGSGYSNYSSSFLFSLTNNFKYYYQPYRMNSYWYKMYIYWVSGSYSRYYYVYTPGMYKMVYHNNNYGPIFGAGHDLCIYSNMTTGYANIGYTYRTRTGNYGSSTARNDFAGSYNSWRVSELEVFYRN